MDNAFAYSFSPLKLIGGSLGLSLANITQKRTVQTGWRVNENKRWWKFWTWFEPSHFPVYGEEKYINGADLRASLLAPIQQWLINNNNDAERYLEQQCVEISLEFECEFHKLNETTKRKLAEIEACATKRDKAQENLAFATSNLQWIENIKKRLDHILAI